MVDGISNVKSTRETGAGSRRSPSAPATTPETVAAVQRSSGKSTVRLELAPGDDGGYIYKLIDSESGETLRQWPAENALAMREYFREKQVQFVDQEA